MEDFSQVSQSSVRNPLTWAVVSEYRNVLFGVSIALILFFHIYYLCAPNVRVHDALEVFRFGNGAVDVFMFLSALGLYFSFRRSPQVAGFFKKRIVRILPVFVLVVIPETVWYHHCVYPQGSLLWDILGVSWVTDDHKTFWFLYAILVAYAAFPLLYSYMERAQSQRGALVRMLILIGVTVVATAWLSYAHPTAYSRLEIGMGRVPAFLLGCVAGKLAFEKAPLKGWHLLALLIAGYGCFGLCQVFTGAFPEVMLSRVYRGLYFILGSIMLCVIMKAVGANPKTKVMNWLGTRSLEIFVVQMTVQSLWGRYGHHVLSTPDFINQVVFVLVFAGVSIALGGLVHLVCKPAVDILSGKRSVIQAKQ